jgi:uncharacterized damage-inducible protein DinB
MRTVHRFGLLAATALGAALVMPAGGQAQQMASTAPVATASAKPPAAMSAMLRDVAMLERKLIGLAEAIPEENFGWRPAEGVRSVGEVMMHVAADNYFIPSFAGTPAPAATGIKDGDYPSVQAFESRTATKAEALQATRDSFAHLRTIMEAVDDAALAEQLNVFGTTMSGMDLWVMSTTHLHEHLGQMIAYARSNGVVPPWSR